MLCCVQKGGRLDNDSTDVTISINRKLFHYLAFHLRDKEYDGIENYIRFMTANLDLKSLPLSSAGNRMLPGMAGPVVNDISWFRYPINIAPCAAAGGQLVGSINSKVNGSRHRRSLFVSVISGPNNFERRATIRRTWPAHFRNQTNLNHPLDVVGFGFLVGLTNNDSVVQQKVKEESETFGDILQVNMIDRYVDLSVKLASLFNWVDTYCPRVDFVLKVDDDVYVNVHNLATVLYSLTVTDQSIYGRQCGGIIPDRKGGKWMTSYENWPWHKFPIYFQGAGVVIAGSAVRPILSAMQVTPYFIWDDMYLVGLCAVKAKVKLRTSNQIFVDMPASYADPCFVRNSVLWTTGSSDAMNSSHFVSHHFYHQSLPKSHCIDKDNKTIDEPADRSDFLFGTSQQN
ncbi:lactosylceramide 1,3-N-acetyl-beta-D-glucosaminyltransferase-like [Daphnia pulicaria]|uniref:lactosylceramide 1,3-N-acetyl-beta-D-glucosaminyltransferase-like n=1 Tax=Daphnia pulicaria TaxID=35523 RepID=UPI001EEBF89B|nr:lactosylceramide 1,3-N-acetyl-beta-D-glucosaminyltransferase-like [Daphnia pulicaria]